jgi:hypothetical protein
MRTVAIIARGTLTAATCFSLLCWPFAAAKLRADTFQVEGKPVEGEIVDLVEEGAYIAHGDEGHTVLWEDLTSFQAKDVRTERTSELRNLRAEAVWLIGTVREVFPQGAVIYTDGRRRANYGAEFNIPQRDPEAPHPRKTLAGAPAASGWYLVTDLPNAEQLIDQTVQIIAYPNGNVEELQLAEENDPEKIPTVTLALPPWAGVRPWTNLEGRSIEAELVYVDGGNCIFEKDGTTMAYPADKLIEAHRKIVQICEDLAKAIFIDPIALQ